MIKPYRGNIWDLAQTHLIVVSTNYGWDPSTDPPNRNNMGAGLARQARDRYPRLAVWYGNYCKEQWEAGNKYPFVVPYQNLILVPVKPMLDPKNPESSWDQKASLDWVRRGIAILYGMAYAAKDKEIALPLIGAGNGGLPADEVRKAIYRSLDGCSDRWFTLVDR